MNKLQKLNELLRKPKLVDVKCTVTDTQGKVDAIKVTVARNKLNRLNGNSLTSLHLFELAKKGRTEVTDMYGNHFVYELLETTTPKFESTANPELNETVVTPDQAVGVLISEAERLNLGYGPDGTSKAKNDKI